MFRLGVNLSLSLPFSSSPFPSLSVYPQRVPGFPHLLSCGEAIVSLFSRVDHQGVLRLVPHGGEPVPVGREGKQSHPDAVDGRQHAGPLARPGRPHHPFVVVAPNQQAENQISD